MREMFLPHSMHTPYDVDALLSAIDRATAEDERGGDHGVVRTRALEPMERTALWSDHEAPETYPSGL